jgi:hypothetical protein
MRKYALVELEAGCSPELFWTLQSKGKYVVQPETELGILGLPTDAYSLHQFSYFRSILHLIKYEIKI